MEWQEIVEKIETEFNKKTVLVIGDLMVDEYVTGVVTRISPEAPVPVFNYGENRLEAGGASNVAHNLRTLGCKVLIAGTAAEDRHGEWLREHLNKSGIETEAIYAEEKRPTTVKTRYATKGQQLIRVDNEDVEKIKKETRKNILDYLRSKSDQVDGVVLSDYKKGVLSDSEFVKKIITFCKENDIKIAIDSKSRNIEAFENADFVKPNNLELQDAVGIRITDDESLNKAGEKYLRKSRAKNLIVTRGAQGISLFRNNEYRKDFPARAVQVYDVTGAGDTVISTVMLASLSNIELSDAIRLANVAAGIVISKVGTVAASTEELIEMIQGNERENRNREGA